MRTHIFLATTAEKDIGIRGEHADADADARAVVLDVMIGVQHDELGMQRRQLVRVDRADRGGSSTRRSARSHVRRAMRAHVGPPGAVRGRGGSGLTRPRRGARSGDWRRPRGGSDCEPAGDEAASVSTDVRKPKMASLGRDRDLVT